MKASGERKVSGGKLLRADVVIDGTIEEVRLHGDFFIYPEEGLEAIEEAVEGLDVDTTVEEIRERIETSLGPNVRTVGFEPQDVATVVKEVVDDAK